MKAKPTRTPRDDALLLQADPSAYFEKLLRELDDLEQRLLRRGDEERPATERCRESARH